MVRGNHNKDVTYYFFFWAFIAIVVGARLGEVIFYHPEKYLRDPVEILNIRGGGLSSHGATIGLILAMFLYSKWYKFSFMEILDRFSISPLMAAIFVRLGNFANSEIVGKKWLGPWAVRFPKHANSLQIKWENFHGKLGHQINALPRHPSQLYEALGAFLIFIIMLLIDNKLKEKRYRGFMAGLFLTLYFTFRFFIEFFKDFQKFQLLKIDNIHKVILTRPTSALTMGQYLSLALIPLGIYMIIWSYKKKLPASHKAPSDESLN